MRFAKGTNAFSYYRPLAVSAEAEILPRATPDSLRKTRSEAG